MTRFDYLMVAVNEWASKPVNTSEESEAVILDHLAKAAFAWARPIVCEECARVIEEKVKPLIAVYPQGPTLAAGLMMAKQLQAAIREHGGVTMDTPPPYEWGIGLRVQTPMTIAGFRIEGFSPDGKEIVAVAVPQVNGQEVVIPDGRDYLLTLRLEAMPSRNGGLGLVKEK